MMIRMAHPQHGEMDVYDETMKVLNENHGWKVVKSPAIVSEPVKEVVEPPARKKRERTPEERAAWGAKMKAAREAKKAAQ